MKRTNGKKKKKSSPSGEWDGSTQWYSGTKVMKVKMTPGIYLRIYRENKGWAQLQLGEILGGIPRQHISNMEHGRRSISSKMARKLLSLLGAPIEKFIETHE